SRIYQSDCWRRRGAVVSDTLCPLVGAGGRGGRNGGESAAVRLICQEAEMGRRSGGPGRSVLGVADGPAEPGKIDRHLVGRDGKGERGMARKAHLEQPVERALVNAHFEVLNPQD